MNTLSDLAPILRDPAVIRHTWIERETGRRAHIDSVAFSGFLGALFPTLVRFRFFDGTFHRWTVEDFIAAFDLARTEAPAGAVWFRAGRVR